MYIRVQYVRLLYTVYITHILYNTLIYITQHIHGIHYTYYMHCVFLHPWHTRHTIQRINDVHDTTYNTRHTIFNAWHTILHCTALHNTAQCNTIPGKIWYMYIDTLIDAFIHTSHCITLLCVAWRCIALHCIVLQRIALHRVGGVASFALHIHIHRCTEHFSTCTVHNRS